MKISTFGIAVVSAVMITIPACGGGGGGGSISPTQTNEVARENTGDGGNPDGNIVAFVSSSDPRDILNVESNSFNQVFAGRDILPQPGGDIGIRVDNIQPAPEGGVAVLVTLNMPNVDGFQIVGGRTDQVVCNIFACTITIPQGERDIYVVLRPRIPDDETLSEEADRLAAEEAARLARVEAERLEMERLAAEEEARLAAEEEARLAANEMERLAAEAELRRLEEAARIAREGSEGIAIPAGRGFVRSLDYTAIGLWLDNGNYHLDGGETNARAPYYTQFIRNNEVSESLPISGMATYNMEGDAIYRGVRFFPDGAITMDFEQLSWEGHISASGGDVNRADDFGSATAMVPDGNGVPRVATSNDFFEMRITDSVIQPNYYSGDDVHRYSITEGVLVTINTEFGNVPEVVGGGFFADLDNTDNTPDLERAYYFHGTFSNAPDYNSSQGAPSELSGIFGILTQEDNNNMIGAFLGSRRDDN